MARRRLSKSQRRPAAGRFRSLRQADAPPRGPGADDLELRDDRRGEGGFLDLPPGGQGSQGPQKIIDLVPMIVLSVWLAVEALEQGIRTSDLDEAHQHMEDAKKQLAILKAYACRVALEG